ncbi:MAG: lasso peptide biosynthesis B2 protein [Rhodothermales bacterium]|nr:lasso peptide biosynthesis B2 protein [Rhodothermales bacterium]MBO6779408.1 lasso peptide biosynthesis B2 protein [Rhodothermales bacterium]
MRQTLARVEVLAELSLARLGWRAVPPPREAPEASEADIRRALALAARVHHVAQVLGLQQACLPRATALHHLLKRRGIPSGFRLGSRLTNGRLESHAWVELGGRVVLGDLPDLETYRPFEVAD